MPNSDIVDLIPHSNTSSPSKISMRANEQQTVPMLSGTFGCTTAPSNMSDFNFLKDILPNINKKPSPKRNKQSSKKLVRSMSSDINQEISPAENEELKHVILLEKLGKMPKNDLLSNLLGIKDDKTPTAKSPTTQLYKIQESSISSGSFQASLSSEMATTKDEREEKEVKPRVNKKQDMRLVHNLDREPAFKVPQKSIVESRSRLSTAPESK